jgi:glycosyltransferase involved in cell wall biosynthesis
MSITSQPKVSICCITYNHEQFISECIEGFLRQKTAFPFEIIIHDDASTDATTEVIDGYRQRYPDRIRLILQKDNIYSRGLNPMSMVFPCCTGDYIAICAGDDYWTSPDKLQRQVDVLENEPEYSIVMHRSDVLQGDRIVKKGGGSDTEYCLADFVTEMKLGSASSSIMVRNLPGIQEDFQSEAKHDNAGGDWLLCVSAMKHGKMKVLGQSMGVYRLHTDSLYSMKPWAVQYGIHVYTAFMVSRLLCERYRKQIKNYNVRKLFLKEASEPGSLNNDDLLLLYEQIEQAPVKRVISRAFVNSKAKKFYLKYLSKIMYYHVRVPRVS